LINDRISLAVVQRPETRSPGRLLEIEGAWARLTVESPKPIGAGDLVEFETEEMLYLGEVESTDSSGAEQQLRVHLEHTLDLDKAAWIQKLWNGG
jgi:hypothetical protein